MQSLTYKYATALFSLAAAFCLVSAQHVATGQPNNIGTLTPLTGFGGPYGSPTGQRVTTVGAAEAQRRKARMPPCPTR
jgi:hypothetical protein